MTFSRAFALLCLFAGAEAAHHNHHAHDHIHSDSKVKESLVKKSGKCEFPSDAGLVAITPGAVNGGWAMSPDESCTPGNYCPYACPPGQMSMQWDPKATSYSYPMSMVGDFKRLNEGRTRANWHRMAVSIAMRMERSKSHSPIGLTVKTVPVPWVSRTSAGRQSLSAKRYFPETRPC
jgi:hypothetical protein